MAALSRSEVYKSMAGKHRKGYRRPVPQRDQGTRELQAKRLAIVGHTIDPKTKQRVARNTQKATWPLDAMLERGFINQDQYNAGRRYGWLYGAVLGRESVVLESMPGSGLVCGEAQACPNCEDCGPRKITNQWRKAGEAIPDRRAKDAVENVAVFGRWPRWFLVLAGRISVHRPSDYADRVALLRGLDALIGVGCIMREKVLDTVQEVA